MFINFFPGHSGQSREISIDEEAAYGLTEDLLREVEAEDQAGQPFSYPPGMA